MSKGCKICSIGTPDPLTGRCVSCVMKEWRDLGIIPIDTNVSSSSVTLEDVRSIWDDISLHIIYAADLMAVNKIKPEEYFKLKHLLLSSDEESVRLAKNIINSRVKIQE